ncbi:MAG: Omp28-related outer membrane protein, partial [Ignavibacteriae bacterium]|nr:Omp28-related outer membrane protein [Ignavibacteriota bacterium]
KIILLIFLILLFGCDENPTENNSDERYGKVYVTCNIENAEIFLDDKTTNQFTPDTITALTTGYIVKVRKFGYFSNKRKIIFDGNKTQTLELNLAKNELKKNVLLENFTNVNCFNCIETNAIINELNTIYGNSLFPINYHYQFPSSNDPFYNESKTTIDQRAYYYGVFETPTIVLDGNKNNNVNDKILLIENIESQLTKLTSFEINVQDSVLNKNGFNVAVFVDVFDTDNLNFNSLFLQIVLVEKNIQFSEAPGTSGEKDFTNVMRAMLPDNNGRSLSGIDKNGRYKFFEYISLNPLWNTDNLFVVAFIQNNLSKEVLQVGSSE